MRYLILLALLLGQNFPQPGPGIPGVISTGPATFSTAVACWSYDNSGDLGNDDCSPDTYDLANNNSTGASTGKCSNAVHTLESASNFLYGTTDVNLNYTTSWSLSTWIYSSTSDLAQNDPTYGGHVLSNIETATAGSWILSVESSGDLNWYFWDATGAGTANTDGRLIWNTAIAADTWYHIVITVSSGGVPTLYIDGTGAGAADTTTTTAGWSGINRVHTGNGYTGNAYIFSGLVDEAAVWDTELASGDVTNLYNSGSAECIN